MRWHTFLVRAFVLVSATFADDAAAAAPVVRLSGEEAVLEVQRDEWVPLCHSPCRVALSPADAPRPLRVRSRERTEYFHANDGELLVKVSDRRSVRSILGIGAGALLASSAVMFGAALYASLHDAASSIGCDDFTGTPDASSYPNGKTCASTGSLAGTYASVGLGLLLVGASAGIAAIALPSSKIVVAPAVARDGASATLSWHF